ncbi:MAG: hypothetical protein ACI8P9_004300 [Parasphingorhabdus sp.]|jgi:hypothetical protein
MRVILSTANDCEENARRSSRAAEKKNYPKQEFQKSLNFGL